MSSAEVDTGPQTNDQNASVVITDPSVDVVLPTLQYGYRTTKATWDELVQIIKIDRNIPKLSRSRPQQHEYEVFRHHMKEQYQSSKDYILISKFDFDAVRISKQNQSGSLWTTKKDALIHSEVRSILVKNDFPYFVEDNIVHYILWKIKEAISPKELTEARKTLRSPPIHALEILEWVNPPNLKSIPEIDHVHFLCRL